MGFEHYSSMPNAFGEIFRRSQTPFWPPESREVRIGSRNRAIRTFLIEIGRFGTLPAMRALSMAIFSIYLCAGAPPCLGESLAAKPDEAIEEILIKGQDPGAPELFVVTPNRATPNAPDSAEMMRLIPGGGVVNNGPLSGQVQYRGMFGNRVGVQIDDMYVAPGGPNWMDPPLHYAPRMLVESLTGRSWPKARGTIHSRGTTWAQPARGRSRGCGRR